MFAGFRALECRKAAIEHGGRTMTVWPVRDLLGEGPLWHPERGELYWFDILGAQLRRLDPRTSVVETLALPEKGSAAAWIDGERLLVALQSGVFVLELGSCRLERVASLPPAAPDIRSNDGRCDPWGRFWIGTMADPVRSGAGALYRLEGRALQRVHGEISVPNTLAFAPDRRRGYRADSPTRRILALEFDPASGALLGERPFAEIEPPCVPDGASVDAEGDLWCAVWEGGAVVRFTPEGREAERLALPVSRPTCPEFGGEGRRTLFVTSAGHGMDDAALGREPWAGGLFAIEAPVAGQAAPAARVTAS